MHIAERNSVRVLLVMRLVLLRRFRRRACCKTMATDPAGRSERVDAARIAIAVCVVMLRILLVVSEEVGF